MSSSTIGTSPRARHHPQQKAALQTGSAAFSLCTGISIRRALLPRREHVARIASVALLHQGSGDHGSTDFFMLVVQCPYCSRPIGGLSEASECQQSWCSIGRPATLPHVLSDTMAPAKQSRPNGHLLLCLATFREMVVRAHRNVRGTPCPTTPSTLRALSTRSTSAN